MDITKITPKAINLAQSAMSRCIKTGAKAPKTVECSEKLTGTLDCLAANAVSAVKSDKKSDIPEFLYHLTGANKANSIIKDGKIKYSTVEVGKNRCSGIYLIDKVNYMKNWCGATVEELFDDIDIGSYLLLHAGQNDKVAALKIPISALDISKLRFRPYFDLAKEYIETQKTGKTSSLLEKGLPVSELAKYSNQPIEFIYRDEIPTKIIQLDSTGYLDYCNAACDTFDKNVVEKLFL